MLDVLNVFRVCNSEVYNMIYKEWKNEVLVKGKKIFHILKDKNGVDELYKNPWPSWLPGTGGPSVYLPHDPLGLRREISGRGVRLCSRRSPRSDWVRLRTVGEFLDGWSNRWV